MTHTMGKQLTIYKASAGSGKTFTLATEYIKLLINNPQSYRNILAVTFTNKATGEMKQRILSQLYGIWKQLPDSASYTEKITKELGVSPQYAANRAGLALRLIIHNYGYFRIQTIDTFFQSVLRNLARELDLTANLRIELNDKQIEYNAVDSLIEDLGPHDDTLTWIMSYIKDNIEDDKDWNVIGAIKSFGEYIFNERYKANSKQLNEILLQPDFFTNYKNKLFAIKNQAIENVKKRGQQFLDIIAQHGIDAYDFRQGKSGVGAYFTKLSQGLLDTPPNTYVTAALEGADNWVAKSMKDKQLQQTIRSLAETTLIDLLRQAENERVQALRNYQSATLTLVHLNQLRLLNRIEAKVREMNTEANRFLLSDTQSLLHALIRNTDSPFIFEKIGTQLEHIMIDEFQDTSTTQWANFKVLLEECMSHGQQGNLIVGDVKQSIYRWRAGDWRLLNNIETHFAHPEDRLSFCPLGTNYRSSRKVITFNNMFFRLAANQEYTDLSDINENLAQQILKAYADVEQQVPEQKPDTGYVRVTLTPKKQEKDCQLEIIRDTIRELLSQNVTPSQIAILARTNNTLHEIGEYLSKEIPEIKLISDEAFTLDSSLAVDIIVEAMHCLVHPEDKLAEATLVKAYHNHVLCDGLTDSELLVCEDKSAALPKTFIQERERLLSTPIYDLAEQLYTLFDLKALKGQEAYLCEFYDALNDFLQDKSTDIDSFTDEWEKSIHKRSIQTNETNGIRLITIHKSKGLEYENVIVPYCDWAKEQKYATFWCSPKEPPFNALPLVSIDYKKNVKGSIYEDEYNEEHLQKTVDNLNVLYVAFTRAEKRLFVIGKKGDNGTQSKLIEDVVTKLEQRLPGSQTTEGTDETPFVYEYGSIGENSESHSKKTSRNVFLSDVEKVDVHISSQTSTAHIDFRQSNKSQQFVSGEEEDLQQSYIKTGNLLHNLFASIRTTADVDKALDQLEADGLLSEGGLSRQKIQHLLQKRFATPQVADWFSDRWQVYNECTILSLDEETHEVVEHRPDRVITDGHQIVIIDFKFGTPKPQYHQQVRQYMDLVTSMGEKNVRGYLWYVYTNKIEEVK